VRGVRDGGEGASFSVWWMVQGLWLRAYGLWSMVRGLWVARRLLGVQGVGFGVYPKPGFAIQRTGVGNYRVGGSSTTLSPTQ